MKRSQIAVREAIKKKPFAISTANGLVKATGYSYHSTRTAVKELGFYKYKPRWSQIIYYSTHEFTDAKKRYCNKFRLLDGIQP